MLQLMHTEIFSNQAKFQDLVDVAHGHLEIIRAHPSPEPGPDSPAHLAFDPTFARHLNTFVPLRILPVPALEDTWKRIDTLLDGWQELTLLSQATNISTWDVRVVWRKVGLY
jgi:hypothetical protein